ncbi:hypothetical protein MycrhN_4401 [Mycolicibacterium rhodesiae NBB3]|uniref:Septum formation-related domain-containing protein n=1 Tax=Mycolicibacterium rhodesiae (strain NBB3) TaxID=710685 RepID=G8RLS2_MYCRN|nr:hypothetical protein [Mycolicibacterium rhodesiae]AEV74895.1 hypothetical protein MycrhN_4401 [Mycolicibacterium rhodesiae NBB3]
MWHPGVAISCVAIAATTLVACGSATEKPISTSTAETYTTPESTFTSAPPATPEPRAKDWFDLDVGDCLVALPHVEAGEVSVDLVDCTRPHAGEVFLRAPTEVNAAIADVADSQCAAGVVDYTGRPGDDAFTVTYLIDSNQDRTSANPLPSTVICLLQARDGRQLTGSARSR